MVRALKLPLAVVLNRCDVGDDRGPAILRAPAHCHPGRDPRRPGRGRGLFARPVGLRRRAAFAGHIRSIAANSDFNSATERPDEGTGCHQRQGRHGQDLGGRVVGQSGRAVRPGRLRRGRRRSAPDPRAADRSAARTSPAAARRGSSPATARPAASARNCAGSTPSTSTVPATAEWPGHFASSRPPARAAACASITAPKGRSSSPRPFAGSGSSPRRAAGRWSTRNWASRPRIRASWLRRFAERPRRWPTDKGLDLILCDGSPGIGCPVIASLDRRESRPVCRRADRLGRSRLPPHRPTDRAVGRAGPAGGEQGGPQPGDRRRARGGGRADTGSSRWAVFPTTAR